MQAFCIYLPEAPERTERAQNHFDELGMNVEFVAGINGPALGLQTEHTYDVNTPGRVIESVSIGACLSHYMVWTMILYNRSIPDDEPVLILEDDAVFDDDWDTRLSQALADTPADADLLYAGNCCAADKSRTRVAGDVWAIDRQPVSAEFARRAGLSERATVDGVALGPQCTHAYVVWPDAVPTLLMTNRKIWAPVDLAMMFQSFPSLNVYTVLPSIASQHSTELPP